MKSLDQSQPEVRGITMRIALGLVVATVISSDIAAQRPQPSLTSPTGARHHQFRYGDGSLAEWCTDQKRRKHGPSESRYPNGKLIARGSFEHGKQTGIWQYFFNDGIKWREDQWELGQQTSSWVNPVVSTLSREELAALGAASDRVVKPQPLKNPRK